MAMARAKNHHGQIGGEFAATAAAAAAAAAAAEAADSDDDDAEMVAASAGRRRGGPEPPRDDDGAGQGDEPMGLSADALALVLERLPTFAYVARLAR